ncbi:MAG: alpha/beta fold hydrolase [Gammaproteobacteria bacterium]|nr:alpha/beta hydrolase [Gammaproteobacteria bacterium]NNJ91554.1 alpha/beta fold hydrolase [Gammaproteobacteria bacterium]
MKFFILMLLFLPVLVVAQVIELETSERYAASASFLEGDADKKALLILHGFLQTRNFSTVKRLGDTLYESGFSILSPTLSLGMHRRQQSMSCEAIHTHSSQSDAAEIKQWIDWLTEKTGKKPTLIGHSSGSITLLNYLDIYGTDGIEKLILISMSPFTNEIEPVDEKNLKWARDDLKSGYDSLYTFKLSYCDTYPSTSSAWLSYKQWDQQKLSELTVKYSDLIHVIIGTSDNRLTMEWRALLQSKGVKISFIEGANHFFDQAHEFDLSDTMESLLDAD